MVVPCCEASTFVTTGSAGTPVSASNMSAIIAAQSST